MDPLWLLLLPVAFLHGWFVGRHYGVRIGAAGMFDQLFDKGTPTDKKGCLLYTSDAADE
mgnify:CR=1 FL=1